MRLKIVSRRRHRRPQVEPLEGRLLLNGGGRDGHRPGVRLRSHTPQTRATSVPLLVGQDSDLVLIGKAEPREPARV